MFETNSLELEDFKDKFLSKGIPVVIRGCMKDLPCSKWNFETLVEECGTNNAQVRKNVNRESYKIGLKYSIEEMKIKEYIHMLLNNPERAKNYYMAVQNIKTALPEIEKECVLPKYIEKKHMGPYLWVGSESHYEFCHVDADDGFLMMIHGKKQVKLFKDLKPLYPNKFGSLGRTIQSQVDCDVFDLDKFPLLKDAVCEEAILEAGDALFIPAFYWHQITSLSSSISMNCFFGDSGSTNFVNKIFDQKYDFLQYWILNIIEQNLEFDGFHVVYNQLEDALFHFLLKQWHEIPSKEQLERLSKDIKEYCDQRGFQPRKLDKLTKSPKLKIRGLLFRNEDK